MKQVIILRKDLNMRKGKMVAQGAHASMAAVLKNLDHKWVKEWLDNSFTKICVSVDSEKELQDIYNAAVRYDYYMPSSLITDNGTTEFDGVPTKTAVAVGPAPNDIVDMFTGDLKLL
jgi:PTH2 family peptidyl-tRNA hydrolase